MVKDLNLEICDAIDPPPLLPAILQLILEHNKVPERVACNGTGLGVLFLATLQGFHKHEPFLGLMKA